MTWQDTIMDRVEQAVGRKADAKTTAENKRLPWTLTGVMIWRCGRGKTILDRK